MKISHVIKPVRGAKKVGDRCLNGQYDAEEMGKLFRKSDFQQRLTLSKNRLQRERERRDEEQIECKTVKMHRKRWEVDESSN